MLEKPIGAIKNGKSKETGNSGYIQQYEDKQNNKQTKQNTKN
jgi:hypothetical protein